MKTVQKKENRRVRYTRMALRESLLAQLATTPLGKISVTRVCEQADVNRSTFYMYYKDVYDLMEQIENDFYEELKTLSSKPVTFPNSYSLLTRIYEIIYKNRDLASVVFGEYGNKQFISKVSSLFNETILDEWRKTLDNPDETSLGYIHTFSVYTNLGMLEHWIARNFNETPEQLAQLTSKLTARGLSAFLPQRKPLD